MKQFHIYFCLILIFTFFLNINVHANQIEDEKIEKISKLSIKELLNVKIESAMKKPKEIKNIPASVYILNREEIKLYGFRSLDQILENVPGFFQIDSYYWLGHSNFGVRGFFSPGNFNDVYIMVNGVNQMGDSYSDFPLSKINVPVEAIERIEIIRGPMSLLYGSGAFMGAINIITNELDPSVDNNCASFSYGSNNTSNYYLRLADIKSDFQYTLNLSFMESDGLDVSLSEFKDDSLWFYNHGQNIHNSTDGLLSENRKYIGLNSKYDDIEIDLSMTELQKGVFDGLPSMGDGVLFVSNTANAQLAYNKKINENFKIKGELGYFNQRFNWEYEEFYENSFATNQTSTTAIEYELNLFYTPLIDLEIVAGYYQRSITYFFKNYDYPIFLPQYTNTEQYLPKDDEINNRAIFAQMDYSILDNLNFTGGLRLEQLDAYKIISSEANHTDKARLLEGVFDKNDVHLIPQAALVYSLNNENVLKALYGKAIKNPSVIEHISQMQTEKPDLNPAEITTYELNYISTIIPKSMINVSFYFNHLHDLIEKRNTLNQETGKWELFSQNLGEIDTKGIEIMIYSEPIKKFNVEFSITLQESANREEKLEDIYPAYSPKYLSYLKLAYEPIKNLKVSLITKTVGEMETYFNPDPKDIHSDLTPKGRIGNKIPTQNMIDFNILAENLFMKDLCLSLNIYNLLDKKYRYPTTSNNSWITKGSLSYGRRIFGRISYRF